MVRDQHRLLDSQIKLPQKIKRPALTSEFARRAHIEQDVVVVIVPAGVGRRIAKHRRQATLLARSLQRPFTQIEIANQQHVVFTAAVAANQPKEFLKVTDLRRRAPRIKMQVHQRKSKRLLGGNLSRAEPAHERLANHHVIRIVDGVGVSVVELDDILVVNKASLLAIIVSPQRRADHKSIRPATAVDSADELGQQRAVLAANLLNRDDVEVSANLC